MRHLAGIAAQNNEEVVRAYRQAVLDGALRKAQAIWDANPDLQETFRQVESTLED